MERKSKIFQELFASLKLLKENDAITQESAVIIAMALREERKADQWLDWVTEALENGDPTETEITLQAVKIAQS